MKKKSEKVGSYLLAYLNMVWTATMVLQSASVSSQPALEDSLLATTTLSAWLMPARNRSSRLFFFGEGIPVG